MEALDALEAIDDDAACALAISKVLTEWPTYHARLRKMRQQRVLNLRAKGDTWEEIGKALGGVHPTRAQQIAKGLRGSKRPARKDTDSDTAE